MTDRHDLRSQNEPAPELRPNPSNELLSERGDKTAAGDPETRRQFPGMTKDEIDRIPVLQPGARLEQGSVYLDLADLEAGPFVALGSESVTDDDRLVAKRDTDYETWNRLAGGREPRTLTP